MLHEFLNIEEAASYVGLSVRSMYLHRHHDTGPESFLINGRVQYRPESLTQWVEAQMAATRRGGITAMS
jgi:predicted DNA-binding transcriptional regulator AlpA